VALGTSGGPKMNLFDMDIVMSSGRAMKISIGKNNRLLITEGVTGKRFLQYRYRPEI